MAHGRIRAWEQAAPVSDERRPSGSCSRPHVQARSLLNSALDDARILLKHRHRGAVVYASFDELLKPSALRVGSCLRHSARRLGAPDEQRSWVRVASLADAIELDFTPEEYCRGTRRARPPGAVVLELAASPHGRQ